MLDPRWGAHPFLVLMERNSSVSLYLSYQDVGSLIPFSDGFWASQRDGVESKGSIASCSHGGSLLEASRHATSQPFASQWQDRVKTPREHHRPLATQLP